jgi:pantoate--beta-alanine ligase
MQTCTMITAFRAARADVASLGFVATMGFLHAGHLSLVRQAKAECGAVAVSIFVNPTQFAAREDIGRYPRDLAHDLALLEAAGVDLVFTPDAAEIYRGGFNTRIEIAGVTERLEGAIRPGHFSGVATVVAKLLNIVQPTRAYFGQKDAQQCAVVRKLVRDLDMPCPIVVGATVREADGLAMSSRNVYLSPDQRARSIVLYRALQAGEERFASGERSAEALRATMRQTLAREADIIVDYVSAADPDTLVELDTVAGGTLLLAAVRLGNTRLLDNIVLQETV